MSQRGNRPSDSTLRWMRNASGDTQYVKRLEWIRTRVDVLVGYPDYCDLCFHNFVYQSDLVNRELEILQCFHILFELFELADPYEGAGDHITT